MYEHFNSFFLNFISPNFEECVLIDNYKTVIYEAEIFNIFFLQTYFPKIFNVNYFVPKIYITKYGYEVL